MSQDEVLRMVATARDNASGPLRKVEAALRGLGKSGSAESKALRESFRLVHEQFGKVADIAKTGVAPAIEAIGLSSLTAVGAMAALVTGLRNFVDQGTDVAAFGRRVQLTINTVRGLEGVADKFHVDPGAVRQGLQGFTDAMFMIRRHQGDVIRKMDLQRPDLAGQLIGMPETIAGNEQALKRFLTVLEDVKRAHGEPDARLWSKEIMGTDVFVDLLRQGNAGLDEAVKLTLQLRGAMDTDASEKWVSNWSDFKATIEGVRNVIGNDLLPDLTELAKQGETFFAANKAVIGREIVSSLREMGHALREMREDLPQIKGLFEDIAIAARGIAATWRFLKMTPGQALTTLMGGHVPDDQISLHHDYDAGPGPGIQYDALESFSPYERQRSSSISLRRNHLGATAAARAAAIIQGLRDRGLDAEHAAILGGNIQQESSFDSGAVGGQGSIGLIQWRLERRAALEHLARLRHKSETDQGTQLDFMIAELKDTPEGRAFLAARSQEGMNEALRRHIRYGDNSEATRLAYGKSLLPLAEKSKPGSLLAAAGQSGMMGGWAGTVTGSASIDVNVTAPRGTSVNASADGLFDQVKVNRGAVMPDAAGSN